MSFQIEINQRLVTVHLEKRRNIKHVYLRVLNPNLIQIKTNIYYTLLDARDLIEKKMTWIENTIIRLEEKNINEDEFLYLGERKKLEDFKIKNIDNFYKKEILKYLPDLVQEYSIKMNLIPTSISYRKNKRTWGSCNYKNGLNFNILLMKFPIELMEYVIIHELAHIQHKNHSKKFWDLVEFYCPDYKKREKIFKNFL
ncbi:MAG: SprT family zinc-dependent metalloprotease [Aliarcobacter sp.]|nr:SprT family zinc-dependent metalloprotease [Aliarcobacter sp.]